MSPLIIAQFMAAAVFFTVAVVHAFVWGQQSGAARVHILFALTAVAAMGNAMCEAWFYRAETVEQFNTAFRWSNTFGPLWALALLWFVVDYTHADRNRHWVAVVLSGMLLFALIVNLASPYGLLYAEITGLRIVNLPWGEQISLAEGRNSLWGLVTDSALFALMLLVGDGCVRLWRGAKGRRAAVMGLTLVILILLFAVHGRLVDTGVLQLPYLTTYGFLIVVVVMSYQLAGEVVRAATLSERVVANERRWHSFLENVRLLVVGTDGEGRVDYVNPCFSAVSGYPADQVLGRDINEFLVDGDNAAVQLHGTTSEGVAPVQTETHLRTARGEARVIQWSGVVLRDPRHRTVGVLRVGAEITAQWHAEAARDQALSDVQRALAEVKTLKNRLEAEVIYLQDELRSVGRFDTMVGTSEPLKYVLRRIEQVAPLSTTVLIEGETGVGKELVARAIHDRSPRSNRPLVKINCSALPPNFIEADLFGHERGAYTGATQRRRGCFELADRGSLFLDEVGELPLELQGKLLRVLQDGEFERLGSESTIKVDVRVIAATNRQLREEARQGHFREDLYYRLHVYPITVPSLRQRKEDIPALVESFVQCFTKAHGKRIDQIPQPVMDALVGYDWPGNVRELENVIERAVITTPDTRLRLAEQLSNGATPTNLENGYRGSLQEVETEYITSVLELCGWRIEGQGGAAELLGLHANTLRSRMRKLGIQRPGT